MPPTIKKQITLLDPISANSVVEILAYMIRRNGGSIAALVQSDLTSISWKTYKVIPPTFNNPVLVTSGNFTVSSTIFDTLQTGAAWPFTNGFNFAGKMPASAFPYAGFYQIQITFNLTGGDSNDVWYIVQALGLGDPNA